MRIALARCPVCKSRLRILPADILPYKHYSLAVIEHGVHLYNQGYLSLRAVVWDRFYGEYAPSHTTLHAWSEGLGAYGSGRCFGEVPYALPASRIVAELEIRTPEIAPLLLSPKLFDPSSPGLTGFENNKKVCCLPAESGRQQNSLNSFDV
jgi:hypothetical protein